MKFSFDFSEREMHIVRFVGGELISEVAREAGQPTTVQRNEVARGGARAQEVQSRNLALQVARDGRSASDVRGAFEWRTAARFPDLQKRTLAEAQKFRKKYVRTRT